MAITSLLAVSEVITGQRFLLGCLQHRPCLFYSIATLSQLSQGSMQGLETLLPGYLTFPANMQGFCVLEQSF